MPELPTTLADTTKGLALDYIRNVTRAIARGMGGKASDAVKLSEAQELEAWMRATATPEQVAELIAAGASDEEILKTARKYRYHLGKAAAQGDPRKEVEYHERMAAKAQAKLAELAAPQPAIDADMAMSGEGG